MCLLVDLSNYFDLKLRREMKRSASNDINEYGRVIKKSESDPIFEYGRVIKRPDLTNSQILREFGRVIKRSHSRGGPRRSLSQRKIVLALPYSQHKILGKSIFFSKFHSNFKIFLITKFFTETYLSHS